MIELAALFFCLCALKFFVDLVVVNKGWVGFLSFSCLGFLQKSTTMLPLWCGMLTFYLCFIVKKKKENNDFDTIDIIKTFMCFIVSIAIGCGWVKYTDYVKKFNAVGQYLTSEAIRSWNFGTLEQRFSAPLWNEVILKRVAIINGGGISLVAIALFLFFGALYLDKNTFFKIKCVIFFCLSISFLQLFVFTNLHVVHNYYQCSFIVFILFPLAISVLYLTEKNKRAGLLFTYLIVGVNFLFFYCSSYYSSLIKSFSCNNDYQVAVAGAIKNLVPRDKYVVIFGDDWSSAISYLSERKAMTVPSWYIHKNDLLLDPTTAFPSDKTGGVVLCNYDQLSFDMLKSWADNNYWRSKYVFGCILFFRLE